MGTAKNPTVTVMAVRRDGSVSLRLAERTTTPGLFIVADCPACTWSSSATRHVHRAWRVQTSFGYLVGDMALRRRRDALSAAAELANIPIDWTDPAVALETDPTPHVAAVLSVLSRWTMASAAA